MSFADSHKPTYFDRQCNVTTNNVMKVYAFFIIHQNNLIKGQTMGIDNKSVNK
jgi:hypothetical protein